MNYSDRHLRQIANYSTVDVMLADVAILKFTGEYWAVLFLLGPPLVFGGAVLALLPARWAAAGSPPASPTGSRQP